MGVFIIHCLFTAYVYLELYLESKHMVDSLGLWYTIYCAFWYTLLTALLIAGLYLSIRKLKTILRNNKTHA